MERNIIYNEDCKITLKRLQDKSIDGIITSPPYNIYFQTKEGIIFMFANVSQIYLGFLFKYIH